MIMLCWLLILALELKDSESTDQIIPHKITVSMTNRFLGEKQVNIHCKDKDHNLGTVTVNVSDTYSFRFFPSFFFNNTLYFCRFMWNGGDHRFDIYVQRRDLLCNDHRCSWDIFEKRPCDVSFGVPSRKCYSWDSSSLETNNTLSS